MLYLVSENGTETEEERLKRLEEVAEVSDDLLEDEDGDEPVLQAGNRSITELARFAANSLGKHHYILINLLIYQHI